MRLYPYDILLLYNNYIKYCFNVIYIEWPHGYRCHSLPGGYGIGMAGGRQQYSFVLRPSLVIIRAGSAAVRPGRNLSVGPGRRRMCHVTSIH